jgi:uncharacterized protein with HEPN domain
VLGKAKAQFDTDVMLQSALLYPIAIIGEASRRLTPSTQVSMSHIPWQQIVAMRNLLNHAYFGVKLDLVWDTATKDMPVLRAAVLAELGPAATPPPPPPPPLRDPPTSP